MPQIAQTTCGHQQNVDNVLSFCLVTAFIISSISRSFHFIRMDFCLHLSLSLHRSISLSLFLSCVCVNVSVLVLVCGLLTVWIIYMSATIFHSHRSGSTHIFYWSLCLLRFSLVSFLCQMFIGKHFLWRFFFHARTFEITIKFLPHPDTLETIDTRERERARGKARKKTPTTAKHAPIQLIPIVWSIFNTINCR